MPDLEFLQCLPEVTCRSDLFPKDGESLRGLLQVKRHGPHLIPEEVGDVRVHGSAVVQAECLRLVWAYEYALTVCSDDGVASGPALVKTLRSHLLVTHEMDVEGSVAEGLIQSAEKPA